MDMKTILLIAALTGGTNVLQYFGVAAPAQTTEAEVTANSDFMRDELKVCLADLKECYVECAHVDSVHGSNPWSDGTLTLGAGDGDWVNAAPYPEQIVR